MALAQLILLWRDQQARCFTAWHFQPAPGERPAQRATKILAILPQFSTLQIYGAILNEAVVAIAQAKPVPASGTAVRLQVDLLPAKPLNPQAGINYLKFSIPGPINELIEIVEAKHFAHPYWQALAKEVWPYLCLPDGTPVKPGREQVYRAEINYLSLDKRPQPQQPPLAAAIKRTAEDLDIAKDSFQKLNTPHERDRVAKYQARLDDLYTWQHLEKSCLEAAQHLPLIAVTAPATAIAATVLAQLAQKATKPPITPDRPKPPLSVPQNAQASPEGAVMTDEQRPVQPEPNALWQDVPLAHFADPSWWLNRFQLKSQYDLSERSYFRWINKLKQHGLSRSLPTQGNALLQLFYRPDIESAIAATNATAIPHRGRPTKGFPTTPPSSPEQAIGTSSPQAPHIQPPAPKPLISQPTLAPQVAAELAQLAASVAALQKQQLNSEQAIAQLHSRFDSLTAQLQQHTQSQQQVEVKDQLLAAFDKLARKILRRTSAQTQNPKAPKAPKAKTRSPRKSKLAPTRARTKAVKALPPSKQKIKTAPAKSKPKTAIRQKPMAKRKAR